MMLSVRRTEKKSGPPVMAAALAAALFSAVWHGLYFTDTLPWHLVYSDVLHLYGEAAAPGWPYIDRLVEYPVLTGLFLKLTGLAQNPLDYYLLNCVLLGALALWSARILSRLAPDQDRMLRFWCLAPSLWFFLLHNWDMLAVFCVVASLACAARGRGAAAGACLALGFSAKLYPIVGLPALMLSRRGPRAWSTPLAGFALAAVAVNGPFALHDFASWSYVFRFNGAHLPNPDSIWSLLRVAFGTGAARLINVLSLAAFAALLGFALGRLRRRSYAELSYGATLAFLLAGKMFSPQYALWLLPFFALLPVPRRWFYVFELSNLVVLFLVLRADLYAHDPRYYWPVMAFVAVRHAALAALFVDATKSHGPQARLA
jgi:hypothetical protein